VCACSTSTVRVSCEAVAHACCTFLTQGICTGQRHAAASNLAANGADLSQLAHSSGAAASMLHLTGLSVLPSGTEILTQEQSAAQLTAEAKARVIPERECVLFIGTPSVTIVYLPTLPLWVCTSWGF